MGAGSHGKSILNFPLKFPSSLDGKLENLLLMAKYVPQKRWDRIKLAHISVGIGNCSTWHGKCSPAPDFGKPMGIEVGTQDPHLQIGFPVVNQASIIRRLL